MKPKQAYMLLAVVLVLIALIAAYEKGYKPWRAEKNEAGALLFPGLEKDAIDRIEILSGETQTALVREGDSVWLVSTSGNYPADPDAVRRALETLAEMKKGIISSTNKDNHARLGVDESGTTVKAGTADQAQAELIVGKQGKNYGTTFARRAGDDVVYLISENLESLFVREQSGWRDKAMFPVELEDIAGISLTEIAGPEEEYGSTTMAGDTGAESGIEESSTMELSRDPESGEWKLLASGNSVEELDRSKADALARSLTGLRAVEFADTVSLAEAGLETPAKKAELRLVDGRTLVLLVGGETESKYYVKRADRDAILQVNQYSITNIFKDRESLLPLPGGISPPDASSFLPAPQLGEDLPTGYGLSPEEE